MVDWGVWTNFRNLIGHRHILAKLISIEISKPYLPDRCQSFSICSYLFVWHTAAEQLCRDL